MIVYVDFEDERLRDQDRAKWEKSLADRLEAKYRFEEISGEPCLIVRYPRVSPALLRELNARAVLVSGNVTNWKKFAEADLAGLRAIFREAAWPTLGFCGGCQFLALTYGAEIAPMGPLRPGDSVPAPELAYSPGMRQERGFLPVRALEPHPLVEGLERSPVMFQAHAWEIKAPPAGFRVLAGSDLCSVQAIAHESAPLFGTQFHPELYDGAHPDGRRVLENFFKLAF